MALFEDDWFDVVIINRIGINKQWVVGNIENPLVKKIFHDAVIADVLKIKGLGKLKIEWITLHHSERRLIFNVSKWFDSEGIELEIGVKV